MPEIENIEDYIRIRNRDPGDFNEDSLRTAWIDEEGGINSVQGTLVDSDDDKMVVQSVLFAVDKWDEEKAQEWMTENYPDAVGIKKSDDEDENVEAVSRYSRVRLAVSTRVVEHKFADDPGTPADSAAPKMSEGMEKFRQAVIDAIDARGWSSWSSPNPQYDFLLQELFVDSAILQDFTDGQFYKVDITNEDGVVTLGEPVAYDITFTPAEGTKKDTEPEPVLVDQAARDRTAVVKVLKLADVASDDKDKKVIAAYSVRICQTGFTRDGRYFDQEPIRAAVEAGLFDGIPCYYQHPSKADEEVGRRDDYACAYIKPGSVRFVETMAGSNVWDVIGTAMVYANDPGRNIDPILHQSLDEKMTGLQMSVIIHGSVEMAKREGRDAEVLTEVKVVKSADFLEGAAFVRTGVLDKIAASNQEDTTMTKAEIEALQKNVKDLTATVTDREKKLALSDRGKSVDELLMLSTLPAKVKTAQRRALMLIEDEKERKESLVAAEGVFYAMAGRTPPNAAMTDDKGKPNAGAMPAGGKVFAAIVGECDDAIVLRARQKTLEETGR